MHGVGGSGVPYLGLHHHQGQPVHEEHDVRDDALLHTPRRVDSKLVDGVESVALGILEVDQPHHRVGLAGDFVDINLRLEQQPVGDLIGLEQPGRPLPEELVAQVVKLPVGEPRLALIGQVDGPHRLAEHLGQNDLPEAHPQARRRIGRDRATPLVDGLPSQPK